MGIVVEDIYEMPIDDSTLFDAVIPFHTKDCDVLPYCIMGLRRYAAGLRNIYVISKEDPEEPDCIWVPEDSFRICVSDVIPSNGREGWYLQQLLKMYAFRVIDGILPYALWYDSDLVMCRPVRFFAEGKILLDWSEPQGHAAYFEHGTKVLGDSFCHVTPDKCGITDHMLVSREVLEGMLQKIETRASEEAWRALLRAVAQKDWGFSGMSEYELYYNYALLWHSDLHELRQLEKGAGTSFRALTEGSPSADIIAFHNWAVVHHRTEIESSRMGVKALGETAKAAL